MPLTGLLGAAAAFVIVPLLAVCLWLALRFRAFRRLLSYDPGLSYSYPLERLGGWSAEVLCQPDGFDFPPFGPSMKAAFVPLDIQATWMGRFCDPWIEMTIAGTTRKQYFERGVCGRRYLNMSGFLTSTPIPPGRVLLRGGHVTFSEQRTQMFGFSEHLERSEKVVVVAPHPDDAEIGAFGVYSSTDAVVVTVTAGDATDSFGNATAGGLRVPRAKVAEIRVWDSITVPRLGGVPPERAVNLAYPDGELAAMFTQPDREFNGRQTEGVDFAALRAMNLSALVPPGRPPCTWRSLVADLERIFRAVQPTVIVTPFPGQDPHPDHLFTTAAVVEALRSAGLQETRVMLTVVHNRWTELYPFGPAGSEMSLPPLFSGDEIECDSLCMMPLSPEQQLAKHLALEAMHDLREVPASSAVDWRGTLRRTRGQVHAAIHGMGLPPTSFLRRAVRPAELFFVVRLDRLELLVKQFTRRLQ